MNALEPARRFHKDWVYVPLILLTLVSFVLAESVYEALAANRPFLAVRQVGNPRLLEIVFVFNFLPALILFLLWSVCRLVHRTLARSYLAVIYGVFFLAFSLQLHHLYLTKWKLFPGAYGLWIIPAILAGFASLRFENRFRSFVLALSPGIVLFPAFFFYRTWMPAKNPAPTIEIAPAQVDQKNGHEKFPPVFLLIFDEFRFRDLLDGNGQIDRALFPNFRELADHSYWFRNATANGDETTLSIPVILTGNFPVGIDPSFQAYPNNLLTLLQPHYNIYIHEVVTHFCIQGRYHCPDAEMVSSDRALLRDVLSIYAARVLPKSFHVGLPEMARSWGPFEDYPQEMTARLNRFRAFLDSLGSIPRDHTFEMFHHMLPHSPYALTREGTIYVAEPSYVDPSIGGNRELLQSLHERYLMQMSYVDKEVGEFIARLKQLGLYDQSLIIITADHGISFRPEAPGRVLTPVNADEVLPVPLFIKAPSQDKGVVTDRDVQDIDLLPTVAGLLGLKVPWAVAGRDIFDPNPKPRMKIAYSEEEPGTQLSFPDTLGVARAGGSPATRKSPLLGQKVATFEVVKDLGILGFLDPLPFSTLEESQAREETAVSVFGWAIRPDSPGVPEIAVAVNGEIVAVTSVCCERPDVATKFKNPEFLKSGWQAGFSSSRLRLEINPVTAYVVLDEQKRRLALLDADGADIIHRIRWVRGGAQQFSGLIGSRVGAFIIEHPKGVRGYLDFLGTSNVRIRPGRDNFPVMVGGWVARLGASGVQEEIVVALNDEIVALTSPCCERPDVAQAFQDRNLLMSGWTTSFSSQKLRAGENRVAAYVLLDARTKRLAPLRAARGFIHVTFE